MNRLQEVTQELDRLRADKKPWEELTDDEYWHLCRMALGAFPSMPKDEIPRRIASIVDAFEK